MTVAADLHGLTGVAGTPGVPAIPEVPEVGVQGGDPRARPATVRLDLSTCVCRYGPPPAALEALRRLPADVLRRHPYGADAELTSAYAAFLGVAADELVAGRGASELIWQLAQSPLGARVVVPLPAYTEYRLAFPGAGRGGPSVHHPLDLVAAQLQAGRVVLLSNPHNPSGRAFDADRLLDLADGCPRGVLVVDESYVEFAPDPARASVLGGPGTGGRSAWPSNLVVLRSPSKFFGVAGARAAVAWSPSERWREALRTQRGSWPVSAIEVAPVAAALADRRWTADTHAALCADARWLDEQLDRPDRPLPGATLVEGSVTHFRLVHVDDAAVAADRLAAAGLGVRPLGPGHGLPGPALRIAAPRAEEREACAAMLDAAASHPR